MRFAKFARFYGWDHEQIEQLDLETADAYWDAISVLESQEALMAMNIADFPHVKKADRQKIYKRLNNLANPKHLVNDSEELTTDELARRIKVLING